MYTAKRILSRSKRFRAWEITMWEYEFSAETTVDAAALWRSWSDPNRWPEWNPGIESFELDGPFAVGTSFRMTSPEGDTVELRFVEIIDGELWSDVFAGEGLEVRTEHRLTALGDGRTRVTYRTEITGPAADTAGPEVGPQITADFPEVVHGLIKHAGESA
ncbi:SRPBCC family protein [Nocardia sp. NPDC058058]|uniref:SRPBCC family protein n=1 Tax=Nocardia sp. NPDC058058 TaxID=3346317 RepID=UPI0036D97BB6